MMGKCNVPSGNKYGVPGFWYVSVFGAFEIPRSVYGTRETQKPPAYRDVFTDTCRSVISSLGLL